MSITPNPEITQFGHKAWIKAHAICAQLPHLVGTAHQSTDTTPTPQFWLFKKPIDHVHITIELQLISFALMKQEPVFTYHTSNNYFRTTQWSSV